MNKMNRKINPSKRFNPSKRKQPIISIERIELKDGVIINGKGKKVADRFQILIHLNNSKFKTFHIYFDNLEANNALTIAKRQFEELKEFLENVKNLA